MVSSLPNVLRYSILWIVDFLRTRLDVRVRWFDIGWVCLTLKMSHGGKWRDFLRSRNRDTYRSWLHRFVRLIFHFLILRH
jgi:hypothetical protein